MSKELRKTLLTLALVLMIAGLAGIIGLRLLSPDKISADAPKTDGGKSEQLHEQDVPDTYTITLVGDCTLAGTGVGSPYDSTVGDDMSYPFGGTIKYFRDDDATIANLECIFSDSALSSDSMFHFKAPTARTKMLTEGSIELVTTANNHSLDYTQQGLDDTVKALEDAGISYGLDDKPVIYTTESGLKIGFYCGYNAMSLTEGMVKDGVKKLKDMDAEYIICAFHWGQEGAYHPNAYQKKLAHAAIDAGADLVYGSHPHVLQPVEEYNGGLILYSLGNFSFGGNSSPSDMDTVIVKLSLERDGKGNVGLAKYKLIPCSISSSDLYNDYRPKPLAEGTDAYARCMSKLDGSFKGPDLVVDYSEEPDVPVTPTPSSAPTPTPTPPPAPTPTPTPPPAPTPTPEPPVEE